ncbi:hypothetical protein [Paenibacillus sedimenti]|uniref:Uncharacterized protein n=1 Tax=Paenibacillus sedimenti TaxID=2770274 RepID=A0A926QNX4_9BACL|nr:hypothetical protein [Paenibacillus sedimenti]MBD0384819.1 hypothetical protein [Paenibacillus sedimenti]
MSKRLKLILYPTLLTLVIAYISAVFILNHLYPIKNYGDGMLVFALEMELGKDIRVVDINHGNQNYIKVRYEINYPTDDNISGSALFKQGLNKQYRLESNSFSTESVLN